MLRAFLASTREYNMYRCYTSLLKRLHAGVTQVYCMQVHVLYIDTTYTFAIDSMLKDMGQSSSEIVATKKKKRTNLYHVSPTVKVCAQQYMCPTN